MQEHGWSPDIIGGSDPAASVVGGALVDDPAVWYQGCPVPGGISVRLLFALLLVPACTLAQDPFEKVEPGGADVWSREDLFVDARMAGTARADLAGASGASAVWANPGARFGDGPRVMVTADLVPGFRALPTNQDTRLWSVAVALERGVFRLSGGVRRTNETAVVLRTAVEPTGTGELAASRTDATVALAVDVGEILQSAWEWSVGVGVRRSGLYQRVTFFGDLPEDIDESVGSFELGTTVARSVRTGSTPVRVEAAVALLNATTRSRLEDTGLEAPARLRGGATGAVSWVRDGRRALDGALAVSWTEDLFAHGDEGIHVGAIVTVFERVVLRAGHDAYRFDGVTSFGVGVRWPAWRGWQVSVDAAHESIDIPTAVDPIDADHLLVGVRVDRVFADQP